MLRKSAYLVSVPLFNNKKKIFFHLHQLLKLRRTENLLLPTQVGSASVKDRFRKLNVFVIAYPQAEIIFPQVCFLCLLALVSALFILLRDWLEDKLQHSQLWYRKLKQKQNQKKVLFRSVKVCKEIILQMYQKYDIFRNMSLMHCHECWTSLWRHR